MGSYSPSKNVNEPEILDGMTKIMFKDPTSSETSSEKGKVIKEGEAEFDSNNWYSYPNKKWANVETADGSMWVWIPRFAYKIKSDKTFDVKFLVGTTDIYYDENNNVKTAIRQEKDTDVIDATKDYVVHPAFTNEKNIKYVNGGWDKELSGIWVAKFEAGYASGNNDVTPKPSNVNYSQTSSWVWKGESGKSSDDWCDARNWLDGIYGSTATAIKYPVFQGITYSMNYININDAFNISKALTDPGNIYNLNSSTTDSHMMKNSEWGACSYLSKSQYGLGSTNIKINNITLDSNGKRDETTETTGGKDTNNVKSVYAVTGVTAITNAANDSGSASFTDKTTFGSRLASQTDNTPVDSVYSWDQLGGVGASTTGTIYGIYDMSGGLWETTSAYVANSNGNLWNYGKSLAYINNDSTKPLTESTRYVTLYAHGEENGSDWNTTRTNNRNANKQRYGDAVIETSTDGNGSTSWYSDYSYFPALGGPFFYRGGGYWNGSNAGSFAFVSDDGDSNYDYGFRPVLVAL